MGVIDSNDEMIKGIQNSGGKGKQHDEMNEPDSEQESRTFANAMTGRKMFESDIK